MDKSPVKHKLTRIVPPVIGILLLLAPSLFWLQQLVPSRAYADGEGATFNWIDDTTIQTKNWTESTRSGAQQTLTFKNSDPGNPDFRYVSNFVAGSSTGHSCTGDTVTLGGGVSTATLTWVESTGTDCATHSKLIAIGSADKAKDVAKLFTGNPFDGDTYTWSDQGTIYASGPRGASFTGTGGIYSTADSSLYCQTTITVNLAKGGDNSKGTLNVGKSGGNGVCTSSSKTVITLTGTANGPTVEGTADSQKDEQAPKCVSVKFSFSWLMCWLIDNGAKAADSMYANIIQPLLVTQPVDITGSKSDPSHIYQIWSSFRILGNIMLVIALLLLVFGQTIGVGITSAYAAKTMLPRLLIAAIGINLSIYFVAAAIDITNIIGNGLAGFINGPFKQSGAFQLHINGTSSGLGLAAIAGGGIWAFASIGPLIQFLFVFLLMPLLLTLIGIMATVIIRRGLLLLLVLAAPLAFAMYCLPNTQEYFKKWWDLLLKTLLVYPIVALIFAIANVLSVTINTGGQTGGIADSIGDIISVIALFIPLFLVPFAFRLAGGAIGKLHDTITEGKNRTSEGFKGNPHDENSRRNRARKTLHDRSILNRERVSGGVNGLQTSDSKSRRRLGRALSPIGRMAGMGDLDYERANITREASEKAELKSHYHPHNTSMEALLSEKGDDGLYHSSLDPHHTFTPIEYATAQRLYGSEKRFGTQTGLGATMSAIDHNLEHVHDNDEYERFLKAAPAAMERMGYSHSEISNNLQGLGIKHEGQRLDLRHSTFHKTEAGWERKIDFKAMSLDLVEGRKTMDVSNQRTSTIRAMGDGWEAANTALRDGTFGEGHAFATREDAEATRSRFTLVAETLQGQRDRRRSPTEKLGETNDGEPVTSASGAGRVNEEIESFIRRAGVK